MEDTDIRLYQLVWIMEENKPRKVEIRRIISEAHTNYVAYRYFIYGGDEVVKEDMYRTKGLLMDAVFNISETLG